MRPPRARRSGSRRHGDPGRTGAAPSPGRRRSAAARRRPFAGPGTPVRAAGTAQPLLGPELLWSPAVDQGTVVKVGPVLDARVVVLDCAHQKGGGRPLEVGLAVGVKSDGPGGTCRLGADEAVAGPVGFGQDAAHHFGVGVVGVTVLAELDGVEVIAHALSPARCRLCGSDEEFAGEVRPQRFGGPHAMPRWSAAERGSWTRQPMSALSPGRRSAVSSRRATRSSCCPVPDPRRSQPMSVSR